MRWAIAFALISVAAYGLSDQLMAAGQARLLSMTVLVVGLTIRLWRPVWGRLWFWPFVGFIILFNIALLLILPWSNDYRPSREQRPFIAADLGIIFALTYGAERLSRSRKR